MTDLTLVAHTTATAHPEPVPLKRVAIIGTAQTWKCCPWQDQSLEVWGLNDAYLIGVPRANRWFDLHPFHQMTFRDPANRVPAGTVPVGSYLRPHNHLEWLKSRPMPVFLAEAKPGWPTAHVFPTKAILDFFATYWPLRLTRTQTIEPGPDYEVSTPSWMLMQAIMEGYREIHVYGIHLATEWEYVQQRPNFEFLLGIAAGKGIKIVLPAATPICQASYRYAFEPKGDLGVQQASLEITRIKQQGAAMKQQLASLPAWAWRRKEALQTQIVALDAALADARQTHSRALLTVRG